MCGGVVTDDIPVEIAEINACAASTMHDLIVFLIHIEIRGRGVALFRCRTKRYGPTREMPSRLLAKVNRRGRI